MVILNMERLIATPERVELIKKYYGGEKLASNDIEFTLQYAKSLEAEFVNKGK